jgi:hypothetical protein
MFGAAILAIAFQFTQPTDIAIHAFEAEGVAIWSLTVARAVNQIDPQILDCSPNICMDVVFSGQFDHARTLAGEEVPSEFHAQVIQHGELPRRYRVLLLLRRMPDGSRKIFAQAIPNQDGVACLEHRWFDGRLPIPDEAAIAGRPGEYCTRP